MPQMVVIFQSIPVKRISLSVVIMLQVCETRTGAATVIRAPRPEQSSYCIYQGICKERLVGTGGPVKTNQVT
eukprot:3823560-Pyramimonas_sp.AAC.1